MNGLTRIIRDALHGRGRSALWTEFIVNFLIVASVCFVMYEQLGQPSVEMLGYLAEVERWLLGIFSAEAILRVWSYRPELLNLLDLRGTRRVRAEILERVKFCLRPWMLLDILTIVSFFPQLRSIRALRLLRLVRFLQLFRYSNPFRRLGRALTENRLQFLLVFFFLGLTIVIGGLAGFLFEANENEQIQTLADAFWWAIVTLTTVGYGDIVPITTMGRLVGSTLMLAGMMNLGLFAAIVGVTLPKALMQVREEQALLSSHLNHWVVCGFEPGAEMFLSLLDEDLDENTTVLLVGPGERPEGISERFVWVEGDPQKQDQLHKVRLSYAAGVVLIARRSLSPQQADASTILSAFTVRSFLDKHGLDDRIKPPLVVAEVLDSENKAHLLTAGVDEVVETNRVGFSLISHALQMPGTARLMGTLASFDGLSFYVGQYPELTTETTFGELSILLKQQKGILLVGFRRVGELEIINPDAETLIGREDVLIYLASAPALA